MDAHEPPVAERHRAIVDRFVAACRADERVLAAILAGFYARGTADAHSDLDLYALAAGGLTPFLVIWLARPLVRASRRPLVDPLAHGAQRPIALGAPAVWRQVLEPPRHPNVGIGLGERRIHLLV